MNTNIIPKLMQVAGNHHHFLRIFIVPLVLQHNGKLMPVCNDRNNPAENKVHHFLWVKLKPLVEVSLFEQSGAVIA